MKRVLLLLLLMPAFTFAAPFDVTVTFSPPVTGGTPDGYNLYIDDCAPTGPIGAGISVASGQKLLVQITCDSTGCITTTN